MTELLESQSNRLDAQGWENLVLDEHREIIEQASHQIRSGHIDPLLTPIIAATDLGWSTLETGSGWAKLSATLAHMGRNVTVMDWSESIVARGLFLLRATEVEGSGVCADLDMPLPFGDGTFDCVWSSGVLEHFDSESQIRILRESARVARRTVISLVPNSLSVPYRFGKWIMEREGRWQFGYERPERSQRQLFKAAGLSNVRETTVDAARAAWFVPRGIVGTRLSSVWRLMCYYLGDTLEQRFRQGYMLVTVGDIS